MPGNAALATAKVRVEQEDALGHVVNDREDLTLREAALTLGFLTAEPFDAWAWPDDPVHPLASRP